MSTDTKVSSSEKGSSDIPPNVLSVELDYITDELKDRARTELLEDEHKRIQSLKLLRSMLEKEDGLCWQDEDLFLLAFLRARKFDVIRAFNLVKGFYTNIGKHGDVYYNLNFERLKEIMEENSFTILPYRDSESSVIIMYRIGAWEPENFSSVEHLITQSLGLIAALRSPSTHIAGFKLIADMKGYSLKHLVHTTPAVLKFFSDIVQSALPIRMRGFHVVNQNHFFSAIWQIAKIFLSKKLLERVHVHGSDMKSLHKFLHPSILPAELDGELPPFDNADWRARMEASTDYIKHVLSFGYEKYLKKDWKKS